MNGVLLSDLVKSPDPSLFYGTNSIGMPTEGLRVIQRFRLAQLIVAIGMAYL